MHSVVTPIHLLRLRTRGAVPRKGRAAALCAMGLLGVILAAGLGLRAPAAQGAEGAFWPSTSGKGSGMVGADALLVPDAQLLDGDQQDYDFEQAALHTPAAFAARLRSGAAFRGLDPAAAARVALKAFSARVGQPVDGPPSLPAGDRISRYLSPTVAQVSLPRGKRAVVESIGPMARRVSRGRFAAIDLALKQSPVGFSPIASGQEVHIPRRVADGVSMPASGVSITPEAAGGRALSGAAGAIDGASVLYANTQTDADTTVKPTSSGFEIGTILRSAASPETLYYKVDAPRGVRLVQRPSGDVQVFAHGVLVGEISAPQALDAEGVRVPVTMSVEGRQLVVHVLSHDGEHMFPIDVDPLYSTVDEQLEGGCIADTFNGEICSEGHAAWKFIPEKANPFTHEGCYCGGVDGNGYIKWYPHESYGGGEFAGILYKTQGESRIYAFRTTSEGTYNSPAWVAMEILSHEGAERRMWTYLNATETGHYATTATICAINVTQNCEPSAGTEGNEARFETQLTAAGGASAFVQEVSKAWVWIAQERGPVLSFQTSRAQIQSAGNRPNVLYGNGAWLGPFSGALEVEALDHGVGVSRFEANIGGYWVGGSEPFAEGKCAGVQCAEFYSTPLTYNSRMPNGEDELEINASDGVGIGTYHVTHNLKVDANPPYNLTVTGWPSTREISATKHTITVKATDGKAPVPSSGMKSIAVKIDGGAETAVPRTSCTPGECTASGEYTIDAEDLPEGVNKLVLTATDNADNVVAEEFTFDVRRGSPMKLGPGTVDPTTGQFELTTADVSLGGTTSVSRVYQSRDLTAGENGPFGPQWALSLGGRESLTVLPDGSVTLTAATGGRTTFTRESNGEFESPPGDSTLKVEPQPSSGEPTEYLVKDSATGTTTRFTQPPGTEKTTPTFASQFGNEDAPPFAPQDDAVDGQGNVWVTDHTNGRVEEFSSAGALIAVYGKGNPGRREFAFPWGIAANAATGNIYVADAGDNRIEELNSGGVFIQAFGWGVSDGSQQFEICTSGCKAGLAGSGAGEVNGETGIAVDPSGNVWVADTNNDRIEEFNSEGHYLQTLSTGTQRPLSIAVTANELYIAMSGSSTIEILSKAGKVEGTFGSEGHGAGQLEVPAAIAVDPRSGAVYVADTGNGRAEEYSSTGTFIAKFATKGSSAGQLSEPSGIAVSPTGGVYLADHNNDRLEEWLRAIWLPTVSEGALTSGTTTQTYGAVALENGETGIYPVEATAPAPVGVSCGATVAELKKGCRALVFQYGTETTAGEAPSEWGQYRGRLKAIRFVAYNPVTRKMEEPVVAEYAYDHQGRLRTEWDPRISPALKVTYGYDEEGHVTAVTKAGLETWTLTYGTIAGDTSAGRLLKTTQAPAATPLWSGETLANSENPAVSGSPDVGVQVGVSHGTWTSTPVSYGYQWFDCPTPAGGGPSCTPIAGATNPNYRVQASDVGYRLGALVTATNGYGSASVLSTTAAVKTSEQGESEGTRYPPSPGWTVEYNVPVSGSGAPYALGGTEVQAWGEKDDPTEATALFAPNTSMGWPASSYEHAMVTYLDEEGRTVNVANPGGGISTTEYNSTNEATRTLTADNRAAALASTHESTSLAAEALDTKYIYNGLGQLTETLGPRHEVKLAHGKKKADEEAAARKRVVYSYDEGEPALDGILGLVTRKVESAQTQAGEQFDARTTLTSYGGQGGLGWKLRKPTAVTLDAAGAALTTTTRYDPQTGSITEVIPPGSANLLLPLYTSRFGAPGSEAGELMSGAAITRDRNGDFWVADTGNNRIDEFLPSGAFALAFGWGVDLGAEKLEVCTSTCRPGIGGSKQAKRGELLRPAGIAYDASNGDLYVADTGNDQIAQFTAVGKLVKVYGKKGASANQYDQPEGLAAASTGAVWVADRLNHRLVEISAKGKYVTSAGVGKGEYSDVSVCGGALFATDHASQRIEEVGTEGTEAVLNSFGGPGSEGGQFTQIGRLGCDTQNGDLYVTDASAGHINVFTHVGQFVGALGTKGANPGELEAPLGITVDEFGDAYVVDSASGHVSEWAPGVGAGASKTAPYGTRTSYYSAEGESATPACRNHPEWADLVCQVEPISQPEAAGLPKLPVTMFTYNMWDETVATLETYGKATREKLETYDAAGRAITSSVVASHTSDAVSPTVTNEYSNASGLLERQSTTAGGKTVAITSTYNRLGQLKTYTDQTGNTTTYEYEAEGAGRLTAVSDSKGSQRYTYNAITGYREQLSDSSAGNFTATYDVEGKMLTETYPNNMTARYGYDSIGRATSIEYVKNAHCAKACPEVWFGDRVVPAIGGETLEETSSLRKASYVYDSDGRLTEVQEIPAGKPCATRLYAYDDESNRTSQTTRQSTTEACATNGGVTEDHAYDAANRLDDPGIEYEEFGDTTKLSAADAGGHEVTSSFYVDGQVKTQTQNGESVSYRYDAAGRTLETASEGSTDSTSVTHYSGPGSAASWIGEGAEQWTRQVPGFNGVLSALATSQGKVTLLVHDLEGNVIGVAAQSESATALLSTYDSTEFGVPTEGTTPPKYAWLGANGLASEPSFESGAVIEGGASYVPQIARELQTASITPPGAFPDGEGETSPYTETITAADLGSAEAQAEQAFAEAEAARQAAARRAACEASVEACTVVEGEDPGWVWIPDISESAALAAGIIAYHDLSYLNIIDDLSKFFHINFLKQAEEWIIKEVTGVNKDEVESWFYALAWDLEGCVEDAFVSPGRDSHCWVYGTYNVHHVKIPIVEIELFSFPALNMKQNAVVAYCPYGESGCYKIEEAPVRGE